MGTPGDREPPEEGGWQSGGWQSQWQRPGGEGWKPPGEQPEPQQQPPGPVGWQQTEDGRWVQTGGTHTSGKSTAALVLGILGLVFCPLICSVLALVFGYQARGEIDASGGRLGGRGNATAGIVLGWVGVAFCVIFVALLIIGLLASDTGSGTGSPAGVPA
jgi:Domain of unknown function (DUF4190)